MNIYLSSSEDRQGRLIVIQYAIDDGKVHEVFSDRFDEVKLEFATIPFDRMVAYQAKPLANKLLNLGFRLPNICCLSVREMIIDETRANLNLFGMARVRGIDGPDPAKGIRDNKFFTPEGHYDTPLFVELTRKVFLAQEAELDQYGSISEIEEQLTRVLIDLERTGVRVDQSKAEQLYTSMSKELRAKQEDFDRTYRGLNYNSPKQLIDVLKPKPANKPGDLWEFEPGIFSKSTKTGQPQVNNALLERMANPLAKAVVDLKRLDKQANVFIKGHILSNIKGGRVFATFHQMLNDRGEGAKTGRITITDPALQQIPKRKEGDGALIRSLFLPNEGEDWACMDYSQMDFRMMAHYVDDEGIIKAYKKDSNADFHAMVAEMTGIERKYAKSINLGLSFGMGKEKLAELCGLTIGEADVLFRDYHSKIPNLRAFLNNASRLGNERGWVRTIMGRRIHFPNRNFHSAGAYIFQGSAADALKMKMVETHKIAKSLGATMLICVHDELDFSVPKGVDFSPVLKAYIDFGTLFRVPIQANLGMGINWWEASK